MHLKKNVNKLSAKETYLMFLNLQNYEKLHLFSFSPGKYFIYDCWMSMKTRFGVCCFLTSLLHLFMFRFTFSAAYYGLAFHISHLFGSKYLNFAISTILDAISVSSLIWIMPR